MCGLILAYDPARTDEDLRQAADRALRRIAHRGPDAEGRCESPGLVVGHRRLSIIDLDASTQPMPEPTGRYLLAFNGEIYNYRELRPGFEPHWTFRTQGDTEVLLAGLVLEGTAFLQRAAGMWAAVLWDQQAHQALLVRDRMGKKPLYYWSDRDRLYIASELPSLLALLPQVPAEDLDSTADYLRYGFYLPGTTAYQGIREVLPGHWLTWSPGAGMATGAYWQLALGGFTGGPREARARLRETLAAAVRRRLVADVEVGAFLSGGVDSSLVVALAAEAAGTPPRTFTIGFADASYDERDYAREVARHLGTRHTEEVLGSFEAADLEHLVLNHVGQPFADSSLLPTTLVSRLAAREVKVALSGDGGDELFGGYQRYLGRSLLRWYTRLPLALRRQAERALRALPEPMAHHSRSLLKKAHLFADLAARAAADTPYLAPLLYDPAEFAALAPDLVGRGHPPPLIPAECDLDDVWRMMAADALIYLPQDILLKVDRASMAASLESRAPFLDHSVAELAFSLPRPMHLAGLSGKRMLAGTFRDLLPPRIWARRKQGFSVPLHQWFAGPMGDELAARLRLTSLPFEPAVIRGLLQDHRQGRRDHGHRLWQIQAYCLWRQAPR